MVSVLIKILIFITFKIEAVFARNDKDGDGKLSKEEFKDMMCREKK